MLSAQPRTSIVRFQGLGQSAQAQNINDFLNTVKSEVIEPTAAKRSFQFRSSVSELRTELKRVCTTADDDPDIGNFLRVVDCWLQESFGWWSEVESIGGQTLAVGNALVEAGLQLQSAITGQTVNSEIAEAIKRKFTPSGGLTQANQIVSMNLRVGTNLQRVGNVLLAQAKSWKETIRRIDTLGPVIRDTVVLFNASLDSGAIDPDDPSTDQLRAAIIDTINTWKFEIVMRAVDSGFITRKFAQQLAQSNAQIIGLQFNLGAASAQLLGTVSSLVDEIQKLSDALDIAALPGRAIDGITNAVGKGIKNIAVDPTIALLKGIAIIGGIALGVTTVALVALRKTGVIGEVKLPFIGK